MKYRDNGRYLSSWERVELWRMEIRETQRLAGDVEALVMQLVHVYFGSRWGLWIRFGNRGPGVCLQWCRPQPDFSERNGFKRVYRAGPFALEFIRAERR